MYFVSCTAVNTLCTFVDVNTSIASTAIHESKKDRPTANAGVGYYQQQGRSG